ncbi:hypothetical protein [Polaribacter glomeratus]|uniref:Outer membrane protein beta-barrel domain-containing protein n=1 Tax=Polaribacter glomeratus TaxID=102 RepID=A0A2S7WUN7_9FLAO|nr:hypothetical protein [Polaribacter glomeratus]PQJ81310.1 hypothetical protein BTO16_01385 [Polaribacter glomeratus]TXD64075.1 hypothetical protein ESX12_16595 [Polaribacter glomeratus]
MKKYIFLLAVLCTSQFISAQNESIPEKKFQKGFGKIDFLSIEMPETTIPNEANMGFTGIHYNLMLNDWSYAGLGIYGAVSGARGGFFTLGINAGIKKYFSDTFYIDTGFHFGGGGGAAAPDGGGAFILPHFNLGYNFKDFSVNSGWSYVNFFDDGLIKGHQLNVGLEIPLDYSYANYNVSGDDFDFEGLQKSSWNVNSKKTSLMLHLNNLMIKGDDNNANVQRFNRATIRLAGFEMASYLTKNWFAFLKVDGAFDGIKAGYMDVFLGAGYHLPFNKNRTNILAKFGVGAGGGGGVDSQGGFLIYPDISIEQQVFNAFYLSLNKGYVMSPNSHFYTSSFGVGLKYYVERNGIISDEKSFSKGTFKGLEIITKQDLYINAKRDGNPTEDMQQISVQVNLDLNKNLYVAGQTSFANFGNAGAYAEGIVGFGAKTNPFLNNKTTFFTQVLAGAAGGGDISTGQGFIVKPSAGFSYQLNDALSLRTAAGYVKAKGGDLSSTFINLGITYHLSFLKMN